MTRSKSHKSEDCIVHEEYTPSLPPPSPEEWTRFVCISDTHSRTFPVPDGDVLLHSGDLTNTGTLEEFERTMEWLYALPHRVKVIIAGNHDLPLHQQDDWYDENYAGWGDKQDISKIMPLLTGDKAKKAGIVYVQDQRVEFQAKEDGRTWSVYGSPWSPEFCDWAFNYWREDGKKLVGAFPKADILMTHGPPLHIFDATTGGVLSGCRDLSNRLPYLRPRIHLFGHIHEGHGAYLHEWLPAQTESPKIQSTQEETALAASGHLPADADVHLEDATECSEPLLLSEGDDRTAFVNAASWPSGKRARQFGNRGLFGRTGFAPVVVDLRD